MEVDVEVREVRSWEVKVLLRNEASVSDTSAAATWISNPRTIRLCPPNPALFIGRLLIAKLSTQLFQRKNLIQFSHAFSFPLLPFMNYFSTLSLFFLVEMFISCSGVAVNSIRLDGNGCSSVGILIILPLLGHDLLHGFCDFLTLSLF